MRILVIETPDEGTGWGISFTSPNPKEEDYFEMKNKEEAFRLKNRIEKLLTDNKRNRADF